MSDKRNYAKEIAKELAQAEADKQALIQEFTKRELEEWTDEDIKQKVREQVLPEAWASLKTLIKNADSESVRASLIKWVFEYAAKPTPQGSDSESEDGKSMKQLLEELAKN